MHKTYLAKLGSLGYIFVADSAWVYLHSNFSGWLRKHVCNVTECIIAVKGHFKVNQGR